MMKRSAIFDKDMKYRYSLKREWDSAKDKVVFILLNPSLADDKEDDRTTKRCINFAKKFGYGSLEIVNLFAYITPYYKEIKDLDKGEAIGGENRNYLIRALNSASKIIAAWGENGTIHQRHKEIEELLNGYDIDCLGDTNRDGYPRHPLYLSNEVELVPYKRPKRKARKLIRTAPENEYHGREGILIDKGKRIFDDSWMWCELCHGDFRLKGLNICESCFESQMQIFKEFLVTHYQLSEKSAKDYIFRLKGIINRGLYKLENEMTPNLKARIEKEFSNSKTHYILAVERYIECKKRYYDDIQSLF